MQISSKQICTYNAQSLAEIQTFTMQYIPGLSGSAHFNRDFPRGPDFDLLLASATLPVNP